jgi:ATP-binding cassette subfamily B protein
MQRLSQSLIESDEMGEVLATPYEVIDSPDAKPLKVSSGRVTFRKVYFNYIQNQPVLKNFNLDILPGEKLALVGSSGEGKSTITKLLLRFMDISDGQILIDDQDVRKVTLESLRKSISYVPQEPLLFHRSILENIRYGKPKATKKEVVEAAKKAFAHDFIEQLSDRYDTIVGERGVKLSGGERQRIAIARAILKNSPILILDEATSALDSESESYVQKALEGLMENRTVIVIAHRLSTIRKMDRIAVIAKGTVKETGTHDELLSSDSGKYQQLWNLQFNK